MSGLLAHDSRQDARAKEIKGIGAGLEPARLLFRDLIFDRILAFEAFRKQAASGGNPGPALVNIANLAHKISGVGATLGFGKAGELAGVLECSILGQPTKRTDPAYFSATVEPLLEDLLVEMESLLDE